MASALGQHVKGRWREFRREPSALFFVVLMPILWMAILGFAFSGGGKPGVGIGLLEGADQSELGMGVRQRLEADPSVRLWIGDRDALLTRMKRGDVTVIIAIDGAASGAARLVLDPTKAEAHAGRAYADDVIQAAGGRKDPVTITDEAVKLPGQRYIDFLVPGLLALSLMTSSLFGTGMTIVANRRENLLKRYLATPMQPLTYILSHLIGRGFILVVEVATILIASFVLFRFRLESRLVDFTLFAALGAGAFTALALLCGARTANMAAMNGATNLISLPMMIVAGVWFSRANFPSWIAEPARYLPLTALVDGLRRIALEGGSLASVGFEAAVLGVYLVAATLAAKTLFKWY